MDSELIAEGPAVRYKDSEYFQPAIRAMRDWVKDCQWNDLEPGEEDELSDHEVLRGVDNHYGGGISQFLTDIGSE